MEIRDIKESLNLNRVLSYYKLQPDRNNRLNCPFHKDKTPSMQVYLETNTVYCFSSNCKTHGKSLDVIDFIMYKENLNKHDAILKAKELIGEPIQKPKRETKQKQTEIISKIFTSFRKGLQSNLAKNPSEYLQQRSLNSELLEVGYNSGQFHHRNRLSEEDFKACINAGLLVPYKGYTPNGNKQVYTAFANNCIIFPLKNKQNKIVSIYGRSLSEKKGEKHYYLKSRSGLYPGYLPNGRQACPETKPITRRLILVEAIIDAATLLQLPKISQEYEILALYGTNGLTEEHKQTIKEAKNLTEIIFFFDGDTAGRTAIEKYSKELKDLLPNIIFSEVETPGGEDVNSLHQMYESEEYFLELLQERKNLFLSNENSNEKKKEQPQTIQSYLDTENPEQIIFESTELKITIWGGIEKENLSRLKVSMHIKSKENKYRSFRDDINLYSHSSTQKLIQNIAETLEISTSIASKTITELTEKLEEYRMNERTAQIKAALPKQYEMSGEEKEQATKFLKSSKLIKNTLETVQQTGLVGEQKNGLLLYFLYLSRLMDEPLHAIIFGKSGSGKTYLQTRISECLPEESVRTITSLTENTLYYSSKGFWKHKVLLIEDLEGVYNAFLPLREFMSKQSITKLTTDKDAKGNNIQKLLTVEGPICVSGATTSGHIYEDNANRSFLLHIDESPNHLDQVMKYQRKLQAGLVNEAQQEQAKQILKNAQRLLKKVKVINRYATDLVIPDCVFKKLRTNMHYLKLIEIITFYNQYQRKWKKNEKGEYYIETSLEDIEWANWLVKDSLLRKSDELNSQLRHFFEGIKRVINREESFYAKQIREHFRMNPMRVNRYLSELEMRGYIKRTGGNRKTGFEYEITSWNEYELLKSGIDILDSVLNKIRAKYNGKSTHKTTVELSIT
ncbi:MAG: CHC2 zinc finger domain-containing protein [Bacteroidales bacterium]|jgi:DNA primase catalytic core|nr:CHC2 zinc finger domain-containing protein [Bacteroidales bacterium]